MFVIMKAKVFTDETGACSDIPVLLTPGGVLEPLLDYFILHAFNRSLQWKKKVTRSVRLFLDYVAINPAEQDSYRLFQTFAQKLFTGTFDIDTGLDPSGLCWSIRSIHDSNRIVNDLTDFFEFVSLTRPSAQNFNPHYAGTSFDKRLDEAAYQFRRDKHLLGHNWASNSSNVGNIVRGCPIPQTTSGNPPAFPEDQFSELILKGFYVRGRYDWRCMLITLLMHGAGFRSSEPMHLYVEDVIPDPLYPDEAIVRIYHPIHGIAPAHWIGKHKGKNNTSRIKYLAEEFSLKPRNLKIGNQHAGWKGGMHKTNEYYKHAYWFSPEYGKLFLKIWYCYLNQLAKIDRFHPFAFVNFDRGLIGAPYSLREFDKAHARACRRIGLTVAKKLGTTPHGHRHAYARRLKKSKVTRENVKRFMHHSAIESQEVYNKDTYEEIRLALEIAAQNLTIDPISTIVIPSIT